MINLTPRPPLHGVERGGRETYFLKTFYRKTNFRQKKAHQDKLMSVVYFKISTADNIANFYSCLSFRFTRDGVGTFLQQSEMQGLPRLRRAIPSAFLDKFYKNFCKANVEEAKNK